MGVHGELGSRKEKVKGSVVKRSDYYLVLRTVEFYSLVILGVLRGNEDLLQTTNCDWKTPIKDRGGSNRLVFPNLKGHPHPLHEALS